MQTQARSKTSAQAIEETVLDVFRPVHPIYCDYIADRIAKALSAPDTMPLIVGVGRVKSDLHPVGGYLLSCTKTISVTDRNGRRYVVTVEEVGS